MANNERDLRELSDRQLDNLSQDVIVEQIRRIEEDPNAFVVPSESSVEEDLKVIDIILAQTNNK
ncbi:hypothetical protein [Chlorogloea sp. CCALA 695]|jgi:hypothetical protein|uniref:hypothetical protein n=1 Tax=Chlorogloea sp. CCALA 695 TaxID=2107693 RepID=UPI0011B28B8D|nr:hypothetical protein [Chlorogloea sp. CCALA 695]